MLLDQAPWYAVGPGVGLVLVSLLALVNVRMGVLGGVTDFVERAGGRTEALGWKGWFLVGIVAGGLLFRLLAGGATTGGGADSYAWLSTAFDGAGVPIACVLVFAGLLIGFGAKHAGGCTSGNGLSGVSFGSPASIVAMGTFMATAIAASLVIEAVV